MTTTAPYGSWRSPITAARLTEKNVRLSEPRIDGGNSYWLEARPEEGGRNALVELNAKGEHRDLLPAPHSVRTRANEYGGGSYTVYAGHVYCVLDADQRVYRLEAGSATPEPVTPEGAYRYADLHLDYRRHRLLCVREDHTVNGVEERAEIVAIDLLEPGNVEVLVSGADFYSNPRISPDGRHMSWLCWHHPQMPWDGTECHLARLDSHGAIFDSAVIAGGPDESIFQPQWSPDGQLYFVSDRSGWWNLYRWNGTGSDALCPMDAEFATPQWVFGMSTYGFLDFHNLLCTYTRNGRWHLARLSLSNGELTPLAENLTDVSGIHCGPGRGLLLGASPKQSATLWRYTDGDTKLKALAHASAKPLPEAYLSLPEAVSFATQDGEQAHGHFYPPHNPDYRAPKDSLPPLLVVCHGGPTGATESSLNPKIQFWTSRGFAVLDVNYRGSTGYGRPYRDRLKGNWGVTDVIDVCSGARHLAKAARAHPDQLAIRGSSAGGYTVLAALTFTDVFKAGASLYGIGDLETLARDTHKFESRYLDSLIGPYPTEQATYRARSPIHAIEQLRCPVIVLQGLQDKVVPPSQAEAVVDALTAKGIANAYVTFAEEGHGFRQADSIQRAMEAELSFYGQIFGFTPADPLEPVAITRPEAH
ncbi:S9 family peptidase [Marinimicrobium alkaliphilum]|uniref:S9 family peptidase n=1 Tax=Marinimicrobium alkaliphilum TaxID=2202654 RepID=UPI000DBA6A2A|nr:prolyl oligopeptidase family serine peptidase [Marinimicrobium alkaliphilum]